MKIESLLFMLNRMTFHTRFIARQSAGLIKGFRVSPSESYAFIQFCVSFLNQSDIYVFWDDLTNSWQLVK